MVGRIQEVVVRVGTVQVHVRMALVAVCVWEVVAGMLEVGEGIFAVEGHIVRFVVVVWHQSLLFVGLVWRVEVQWD